MQKQTQTFAEKLRQEEQGHTRGHHSSGLTRVSSSLFSKGATQWARGQCKASRATGPDWNPVGRPKILDEVRFCRLDTTYKADVKRITLRSTRANKGRAQVRTSSTHSTGTRAPDISGRSLEDLKIKVKAFLVERGKQAARRATTQCRASTYNA